MAKLARTRLAGTIVATALCAAAADAAVAQDGALVLNNQLQLGDVVAGQTLNVVDVRGQVTASTAAQSNAAIGGADNGRLNLRSDQIARGETVARTSMTLRGDTTGPVTGVIQARGNYLAATTNNAASTINARQSVEDDVRARSEIVNSDARLLGGANIAVGAFGNTTALGGTNTAVRGTIEQTTTGDVRAHNVANTQYIPAPADFSGQAVANAVQITSAGASNQNTTIRQRSQGGMVEAAVNPNAGNAWDLAGRANAAGNLAATYNRGGALITRTDQENDAQIRSAARVFAYDYGRAVASANGVGNEVSVGNQDIYVKIDNSQLNSGGVDATATFQGGKGYDAYVGANATGNSVTGYACSTCGGDLNANSVQVNNGNINAVANTVISGSSRHVISGANAVGNAASFYVTGNGGG